MKRPLILFFLILSLLTLATPGKAETKTDTIRLEVKPEGASDTLKYSFRSRVRNGIEIEWISADGSGNSKFKPDENGNYTQTISTDGWVYIYYTYDEAAVFKDIEVYIATPSSYNSDIKVICNNRTAITSLDVSGCTFFAKFYPYVDFTFLNVSGTVLTDLSIYSKKMTKLNASGCTSLESLYSEFNQLTSLDVSGCTALKWLRCSENQLAELDVSDCIALEYLVCISNQLTSLDVSKNTVLRKLSCEGNQLTELNVRGCTALMELDCGNVLRGNQLTELDVSGCTALRELSCSNNQLTELDVSKNTALTELYCFNNQLTSLDVSKNTALTELSCSNNQLTELDVSKNTALTELSCHSNQLTELDVSKNTALTELYCYSNQLTKLDVSKDTVLTKLSCHRNRLTELDVSKNTALTELSCYSNQLTELDMSSCTALAKLECGGWGAREGNQLTKLDVSQNIALTYLWCNNNQLTELDISKNTNLKTLNVSNNRIPLSILYKCYIQNSNWSMFSAAGQSDSLILSINQPFDLSSERMLGDNLTDYKLINLIIKPETYYTEDDFIFRFKASREYVLNLTNPAFSPTFRWYISVRIFDTVTLASNNDSWGSVSQSGTGIYEKDSLVTITATPKEGSHFVNWTRDGDVFCTKSDTTFAVTENMALTANFELDTYTVSLTTNNTDWGSVLQSGDGIYEHGSAVTITAIPKEDYHFVNWTKDGLVFSTKSDTTFAVTENMALTANFEIDTYTIILSSNNTDWGSVLQSGNGIYEHGTAVTITATPKEDYHFVNWTRDGDVFCTKVDTTFAVTENMELTANFELDTYTVSLTANNTDWGSVSQSGNGIYGKGTEVTITATPKEDYHFINWTKEDGDVFCTKADTTFAITEDLTLVAHFEEIPIVVKDFTVTLTPNNPAWGMVLKTGNCIYAEGDEITILALPFAGYRFVNWTKENGSVFSTDSLITFKVTESLDLTANFEPIPAVKSELRVDSIPVGTVAPPLLPNHGLPGFPAEAYLFEAGELMHTAVFHGDSAVLRVCPGNELRLAIATSGGEGVLTYTWTADGGGATVYESEAVLAEWPHVTQDSVLVLFFSDSGTHLLNCHIVDGVGSALDVRVHVDYNTPEPLYIEVRPKTTSSKFYENQAVYFHARPQRYADYYWFRMGGQEGNEEITDQTVLQEAIYPASFKMDRNEESRGSVWVSAMDRNGCRLWDSAGVELMRLPNVMVLNDPNRPLDGVLFPEFEVEITNTWGLCIKSFTERNGNGNSLGWDGSTRSGSKVTAGTYYYKVKIPTLEGFVYMNGAVTVVNR